MQFRKQRGTSTERHSLWKLLEREVLPFVTKPGRYVGNEVNSIHKPHDRNVLKFALCYPEMYEIGMSYLGLQILYHLINRRHDCLAERAFAVWPDMEERMRRKKIPLFSLESSTPISEFEVVGFHICYEMNYTTVLSMLDLAGIPLQSERRTEGHPLVLAGGSSVLNPEPMADFVDAFFIGDAEEAIDEIIGSIIASRSANLSRQETLLKLASIPGMYVPRFYRPNYDSEGKFISLKKLHPAVPEKIKVRSVDELKDEYYPEAPVVPYLETSHDHLSVEVMRGCVRGCRFCQAGYQYRPRRQRVSQSVSRQIFASIPATGYDDVSLLSLSTTDYEYLDQLLAVISPRLRELKIGLSLPSLRPETVTASLLEAVSTTRKSGLTLAPEAGTERLRKVLGKDIKETDIISTMELALKAGWRSFKLYFMVGLPTETDADIEGIITLLRKISHLCRKQRGKVVVNVTLSPFNPKSHTPWQWERQEGVHELLKKIDRIKRGLGKTNVQIKYPDLEISHLEGILGRGDRRLGNVILEAYRRGARLDAWSEWFDARKWYEAFGQTGLKPEEYTGPIDEKLPLYWEHIEKGIPTGYFRQEAQRSKQAILPPGRFSRRGNRVPSFSEDSLFGRRRRLSVARVRPSIGACRIRIRYERRPELRFLSHLDTIRTLYRSVRRSGLPVAFSQGYHPHMKLSFGPPLPLGFTSRAEYFDIELTQPYREEFIIQLSNALPPGLAISGHKHYLAKGGSLSKQLNLAHYLIPCTDGLDYRSSQLEQIASTKRLMVTRVRGDTRQEVEVGRFIDELRPVDEGLLVSLWQLPDGHIKPEEILIFGLGIDVAIVRSLVINRENQFHKVGFRLIDPMDLV